MQEFFEKPMFTIPVVRNHAVSRMGMQLQFSISLFCFPLIIIVLIGNFPEKAGKFPIDLIH